MVTFRLTAGWGNSEAVIGKKQMVDRQQKLASLFSCLRTGQKPAADCGLTFPGEKLPDNFPVLRAGLGGRGMNRSYEKEEQGGQEQ